MTDERRALLNLKRKRKREPAKPPRVKLRNPTYSQLVLPLSMRSIYWQYFGFPADAQGHIVDRARIVCILCKVYIAYHRNTSNLKMHLQTKHSSELLAIESNAKAWRTKAMKQTLSEPNDLGGSHVGTHSDVDPSERSAEVNASDSDGAQSFFYPEITYSKKRESNVKCYMKDIADDSDAEDPGNVEDEPPNSYPCGYVDCSAFFTCLADLEEHQIVHSGEPKPEPDDKNVKYYVCYTDGDFNPNSEYVYYVSCNDNSEVSATTGTGTQKCEIIDATLKQAIFGTENRECDNGEFGADGNQVYQHSIFESCSPNYPVEESSEYDFSGVVHDTEVIGHRVECEGDITHYTSTFEHYNVSIATQELLQKQARFDQDEITNAELQKNSLKKRRCKHCPMEFNAGHALKCQHSTFECEYIKCYEKFSSEKELKAHHKIHKNVYKCDAKGCSAAFSTSFYLRMHVVNHSSPYKCRNCKDRFGTLLARQAHVALMHKKGRKRSASIGPKLKS